MLCNELLLSAVLALQVNKCVEWIVMWTFKKTAKAANANWKLKNEDF